MHRGKRKLFSHWLLNVTSSVIGLSRNLSQSQPSISNFQFPKSNFFQELHKLPHDKRWEKKDEEAFPGPFFQIVMWTRTFLLCDCDVSRQQKSITPGCVALIRCICSLRQKLHSYQEKYRNTEGGSHLLSGLKMVPQNKRDSPAHWHF